MKKALFLMSFVSTFLFSSLAFGGTFMYHGCINLDYYGSDSAIVTQNNVDSREIKDRSSNNNKVQKSENNNSSNSSSVSEDARRRAMRDYELRRDPSSPYYRGNPVR